MSPPRARARIRRTTNAPAAPPHASPDSPPDMEDVPFDTVRMRRVLELTAASRTQAEIARAIGCTERTIRNILKAARANQLATFRSRSAEAVAADIAHRHAVQYGRWAGVWARARNSGNIKAEIAALARMDQSLYGYAATLARVGFFDGTTFNTGSDDNGLHNIKRDREEISALVAMSAAVNRGDDIESVQLRTADEGSPFDPDDPLFG